MHEYNYTQIKLISSEVTPTEWTLVGFCEPFFHTAPVENVLAWKFLDDLIFFKALDTDGARSRTLLHDHCLYPERLLLQQYFLRVHGDLVDCGGKGNDIS